MGGGRVESETVVLEQARDEDDEDDVDGEEREEEVVEDL